MDTGIEPWGSDYSIGQLETIEDHPSDVLINDIGWRVEIYDFDFLSANIMIGAGAVTASSSWIEVAYSRQLGGCFVVWFSGVSSLTAPDFCSYGWIDCKNLGGFEDALFRRSLLQGAPVCGYQFDVDGYYRRQRRAHLGI